MTTKSMPTASKNIAGIVLAGGQSSRMGTSKALLDYHGKPLIEHMIELLRQAGCDDVHISGDVPGYRGIPDAVRHDGPARAMLALLRHFKDHYERLLFVPVDMPLIAVNSLRHLMSQNGSVFYNAYPLPACLNTTGFFPSCDSVRDVLVAVGAKEIELPQEWESGMANINTKKEWENLAS